MNAPRDSLSEAVRVAGRSNKLRAALITALISVSGSALGLLRWSLAEPWKLDTKWTEQWTYGASIAKDAKIQTIALDTRMQISTRRIWKAIVELEYEMYCPNTTLSGRATCSAAGAQDFENALEATGSEGPQAEALRLILQRRARAQALQ